MLATLGAMALLVAGAGSAEPQPAAKQAPSGATLFAENCAVCHTLPILASLFEQNRGRAPGFVYDALTEGNMRRVGESLDDASRRAVAEFFTGVPFDSKAAEGAPTPPQRAATNLSNVARWSFPRVRRDH